MIGTMKGLFFITFALISLHVCPFVSSLIFKNNTVETLCAIKCHIDQDCNRYIYLEGKHLSHEMNGIGSFVTSDCIFINKGECVPIHEVVPNIVIKTIITTKGVIHTSNQTSHFTFESNALEAGFNQSITVSSDTIFLKEVHSNDTYDDAMLKCLSWGGILPMEETNEFVDHMSVLSGDPISPRFLSLAQESSLHNVPKSLVWTVGKIVWSEGESVTKCPKCQNWIFSEEARQVATINPSNKMYESISLSDRIPKYFCQYIGVNLATHKRVLVSSTYSGWAKPQFAVDGLPNQSSGFWHSGNKMTKGEWISVDLGREFWISRAFFLGRFNGNMCRNRNVQVWVGGPEPNGGSDLDTTERQLCGLYPFHHQQIQLSGVTCPFLMLGRFVTFLNSPEKEFFEINELAIYGPSMKKDIRFR